MSGILHATVERTERVIVKVDIAKHIAAYPREYAQFAGNDVEFVKRSLNEIGVYDLLNSGGEEIDDGISVEPDLDEEDIDIIGVVPA